MVETSGRGGGLLQHLFVPFPIKRCNSINVRSPNWGLFLVNTRMVDQSTDTTVQCASIYFISIMNNGNQPSVTQSMSLMIIKY